MTAGRFQLSGRADVLGVWAAAPAPAFAPSFDAGADDEVWRVDVPAVGARDALADRRAALAEAEAATRAAADRLAAFPAPPGPGMAYAAPAYLPPAEWELAAWAWPGTAPDVAFGLSFGWFGGLREAAEEAWAFLRETARSLTVAARVETVIGGVAVGRTTVGWRGGTVSTWRSGVDADQAEVHRQALALALASRRAWVRLAAVLIGGAVGLAARLATVGGWLTAIPAVWRFIRRVRTEVTALRSG